MVGAFTPARPSLRLQPRWWLLDARPLTINRQVSRDRLAPVTVGANNATGQPAIPPFGYHDNDARITSCNNGISDITGATRVVQSGL